jgi:diadenosine tetraphosphatase ApaH/serine/threonine PP2A family protein phosphatase
VRYLVLSDIHGNLAALGAVLADASHFDEIWCLGDLVGYGPHPNECVACIQEHAHCSLAGNHDWAALGRLDLSAFNVDARVASIWTQSQLNLRTREYLEGLSTLVEMDDFCMAHASPREPVWEYILDIGLAAANFARFSTTYCLVGHTHVPLVFEWDEENERCTASRPSFSEPLVLGSSRLIINPGSVGQPRDGDPRASYALLDTDERTFEFRRTAYPVQITQEQMRARGLPRRLIDRLAVGR